MSDVSNGGNLRLADDLQDAGVRDIYALRDCTQTHAFGVGLTDTLPPGVLRLFALAGEMSQLSSGHLKDFHYLDGLVCVDVGLPSADCPDGLVVDVDGIAAHFHDRTTVVHAECFENVGVGRGVELHRLDALQLHVSEKRVVVDDARDGKVLGVHDAPLVGIHAVRIDTKECSVK